MRQVIDMGVGFDDIELVLDLSDFLSNSKELVAKFEPAVSSFLVKKDFFKGPFLREYNHQFDVLIRSLLRKEVTAHFTSWTPEDICLLTEDIDFLKMLAQELFEQESYRKQKMI